VELQMQRLFRSIFLAFIVLMLLSHSVHAQNDKFPLGQIFVVKDKYPWAVTAERELLVNEDIVTFDMRIMIRLKDYYDQSFDYDFFHRIFHDIIEVCNGVLNKNIENGIATLNMSKNTTISFSISFSQPRQIGEIDSILYLIDYQNSRCVGPRKISGSSVIVYRKTK